ncbi:anti-repressor SinI family protein [Mesobacillus maritimus]|nr:anti-repressor SinI family protein [Mesobacillus maritimus]MCM3670923.1 anti-repressor SinI family protein [Mesobacillus maritimus]
MVTAVLAQELNLDLEWVELISEALDLGIPIEDIRAFLNE